MLSAMKERERERRSKEEGDKQTGGEIYPFWVELLDTHIVSLSTLHPHSLVLVSL
jgi:hypothetical protein